MKNTKDKSAVNLGRKSWEKRTEGKNEIQIKEMMSMLRKGKKLTTNA